MSDADQDPERFRSSPPQDGGVVVDVSGAAARDSNESSINSAHDVINHEEQGTPTRRFSRDVVIDDVLVVNHEDQETTTTTSTFSRNVVVLPIRDVRVVVEGVVNVTEAGQQHDHQQDDEVRPVYHHQTVDAAVNATTSSAQPSETRVSCFMLRLPSNTIRRCYKALTCHRSHSNPMLSTNVVHQPPPLSQAPPVYSFIMRFNNDHDDDDDNDHRTLQNIRPQDSTQFVAPQPPPPYAVAPPLPPVASAMETIWGPEPMVVVCPFCRHVTETTIETERSSFAHASAITMFLSGCWPCCVLPYCMESCKNTRHFCPICQQLLGVYRQW